MRKAATRRPAILAIAFGVAFGGLVGTAGAVSPGYSEVEPLFRAHCVGCHSGPEAPLGLRLDSYESIRRGSDNGPIATPRQAGNSELLRRLRGDSRPRMPLTGPPYLPDADVARIEVWITEGMQLRAEVRDEARAAPPVRVSAPRSGTWASVASIFLQRCVKCHANGGALGAAPEGRHLGTWEQVLSAGERAVVVPGTPAASELVRRVRGQARPRMPLDGPPYLAAEQIAAIEAWIAAGAPDDRGRVAPVPVGAQVRLHGTLTAPRLLDDLPLQVAPEARVRAPIGAYVRVKGTVGVNGGIRANEIRARSREAEDRPGRRGRDRR